MKFWLAKSWDKFEKQPYSDPFFRLSRASNLMTAISTQIIPSTDIDDLNRLREDLGIAPITQKDYLSLMEMQAILSANQQNMF